MKAKISVLLVVSLLHYNTMANGNFPRDMNDFIADRELCDYFRTQEPNDKEQENFYKKNTERFCSGSDKKLAELKKKYKQREDFIEKLNEFDSNIEYENGK